MNADSNLKTSKLPALSKKLTYQEGAAVRIGVLKPFDDTDADISDTVNQNVISTFARYGISNLTLINKKISRISLQALRQIVVDSKVDLVILTVLKPTNVDVFLYDRRTPYRIFFHSEMLPEEVQYRVSKNELEEYNRIALRRTLYNYLQDLGVDLPREKSKSVLNADIPHWVVSPRTFVVVNRELISRFYGAVVVGGAISVGQGNVTGSNLIGLEFGVRIKDGFYAQLSDSWCAQNLVALSTQYMFENKDSPFRTLVGLGGGFLTLDKTLNREDVQTQPPNSWYLMTSAGVTFPIVEVHIKIESQIYFGLSRGTGTVFTLQPGLFLMF